jgi:hypothetical protein
VPQGPGGSSGVTVLAETGLVQGRGCDGCTLCCKLLEVRSLAKPANSWCPDCAVGQGCRIYATRPQDCRDFFCEFLLSAAIGDHWKPTRSRMVIVRPEHRKGIAVHVDPGRPDSWRAQPFYDDLKRWSRANIHKQQILVKVGDRYFAILPDEDVDLGILADGQLVQTSQEWINGRQRWVAKVIAAPPRP